MLDQHLYPDGVSLSPCCVRAANGESEPAICSLLTLCCLYRLV